MKIVSDYRPYSHSIFVLIQYYSFKPEISLVQGSRKALSKNN